METKLLRTSYPGELWFIGELIGETFSPKVGEWFNCGRSQDAGNRSTTCSSPTSLVFTASFFFNDV